MIKYKVYFTMYDYEHGHFECHQEFDNLEEAKEFKKQLLSWVAYRYEPIINETVEEVLHEFVLDYVGFGGYLASAGAITEFSEKVIG